MEDKQQSTPANGADWDADGLRVLLGQRLRMARTTLGLSQQAVADAMVERGFNWRQTTVAKTEGADRPTLFTEVVALSSILKRDLSFFLSGRTALDEVKEKAQHDLSQWRIEVDLLQTQLRDGLNSLDRAMAYERAVSAVLEYSNSLDGGLLKDAIDAYAEREDFTVPRVKVILEAAGVPGGIIEEIDKYALHEVGRATLKSLEAKNLIPAKEADASKEPRHLRYLQRLLNGEVVPGFFLENLRRSDLYRQTVTPLVIDALIEHVEPRSDYPRFQANTTAS